jgi:hypothetical protein
LNSSKHATLNYSYVTPYKHRDGDLWWFLLVKMSIIFNVTVKDENFLIRSAFQLLRQDFAAWIF